MHEQEFRQALRDGMALVTTPTMSEFRMLDAAKQAARRRRAGWASVASAVAVALLATGVVHTITGSDGSGTSSAGSSHAELNGLRGHPVVTATSGSHYERGVDLLDELLGVVPQGYDSPARLPTGVQVREHRAVRSDIGKWGYLATIPLVKSGELGALSVSVYPAVDDLGADQDPCELSISLLNPRSSVSKHTGESCEWVTAGGKLVGAATSSGEMVVAYRHSDDTLVVLAQEALLAGYGSPGLTELPFTAEQLAGLAADPRFHVT